MAGPDDRNAELGDYSELRTTQDEFQGVMASICFVSNKAAVDVLASMPADITIQTLRSVAAATRCDAIEGCALKLRFKDILKTAAASRTNVRVTVPGGTNESWPLASYHQLVAPVVRDLTANPYPGRWTWIGGNQTGFDAVSVYERGKIRFAH